MGKEKVFQCNACQALHPRSQLARGQWGDWCCPSCGSPDITRHRSRFDEWYAIFFLYKVY